MKCIELLGLYLEPERSPSNRAVSSTSTCTSSSGESTLFPPTPLSPTTSSSSDGRLSPSPAPPSNEKATAGYADLNIAFIPQTPRKPPQPKLGYLTPSTSSRRYSNSTSSTPIPRTTSSPSSRHLVTMTIPDEGPPLTPKANRETAQWATSESTLGLGLGLPRSTSVRSQSLAPPTAPNAVQRSPSRPRRAFPSELTRGLPSAASSPNLASPLTASKCVHSASRTISGKTGKDGKVRSVEEKKEFVSPLRMESGVRTDGD